MLKNFASKQTSPNQAMGRSQILRLGVILIIAGILALAGWVSWLKVISHSQFARDNSATLISSIQSQNKAAVAVDPYTPVTSLTGAFALVADPGNQTIRRIDLTTGKVTPVAGLAGAVGNADGVAAEARFRDPARVAVSADRTFALVADTGNHAIRRIDLTTGAVTTLAGLAGLAGSDDGKGSNARFYYPHSVALSVAGTFALVADSHNQTIRRIDLSTNEVTTLAGQAGIDGSADGVGSSARFYCPMDVAISPADTFALVADYCNQTIRRIDLSTNQVTTLAGHTEFASSDDGFGNQATFNGPISIAISPNSTFALVVDFDNEAIRRIDLSTGEVRTPARSVYNTLYGVNTASGINKPRDVSISPGGDFALVTAVDNQSIERINLGTGAVILLALNNQPQ